MTTQADLLLAEVRKHLGMRGRPNAATQWYAAGHGQEYADAAWCDMFISWCAKLTGLGTAVGEFAYCPSHINWFKRMGQWGGTPKKGYIVFFDWDDDGVADHVGIVEAVNKDGSLVTLEGNASNEVQRKTRYRSDVIGYGMPVYRVTPEPYPGTVLKKGSKGASVKLAQKQLTKRGYPTTRYGFDGIFGDETEREVRAFQRVERSKNAAVVVDGEIGPMTWRLLFG